MATGDSLEVIGVDAITWGLTGLNIAPLSQELAVAISQVSTDAPTVRAEYSMPSSPVMKVTGSYTDVGTYEVAIEPEETLESEVVKCFVPGMAQNEEYLVLDNAVKQIFATVTYALNGVIFTIKTVDVATELLADGLLSGFPLYVKLYPCTPEVLN